MVNPMDRALANEYLLELVKHYLQGQQTPLEFMLETAWELTRPAKVGGKVYNNEANSEKAFWGTEGSFGYAGERDDIHHKRCIDDLTAIPQQTIELADVVFTPWIELMEVHAHDA